MKHLLLIALFSFATTISIGQINTDTAIASCCEEGRGCSGSAYCSACKNCTGCKHCAKNGGSCGVCNGESSRKYTKSKRSPKSSIKSGRAHKFSIGDNLQITTATLNLRKGPGTKYEILKKLEPNHLLEIIAYQGRWLKVTVMNTEVVGFVYDRYVKKI